MQDPDWTAPGDGDTADGLDRAAAIRLANGEHLPPAAAGPMALAPPKMPLVIAEALAFLQSCVSAHPRVKYGLGAKAQSDTQAPGAGGFTAIDCSGFVRAAVRRSTHPEQSAFPDGSVTQHDWVRNKGYAAGTVHDGQKADGQVRIAFLDPHDTKEKIGHVVLIHDGQTLESHGGVGPDRRPWTGESWQKLTKVYLLT